MELCWKLFDLEPGDKNGNIKIFNTRSWMAEKEIQTEAACVGMAFQGFNLYVSDDKGHVTHIR